MSSPTPYGLDLNGFFMRYGTRIFPVGVNYWPASSGLRMWERWDAEEVARDLDTITSLGLNAIRFFLRWQDFESESGRYDEIQFERLNWLLAQCAQRRLHVTPSLFVGWMSGSIFLPGWKGGRNLFRDPQTIERSEAFAPAL